MMTYLLYIVACLLIAFLIPQPSLQKLSDYNKRLQSLRQGQNSCVRWNPVLLQRPVI